MSLQAAIESNGKSPRTRLAPAAYFPPTLPELITRPCFCTSMRQTLQEEANLIHAFDTNKSFIKAAENAIS